MLREGQVDFAGTYYQAEQCELRPRGPRPSGPPVLFGGTGKRILELEATVLESVARMDGGVVMDREGNLLAVGAILRNEACGQDQLVAEGGRTTAAMSASRFGNVLQISEDGLVTYYRDSAAVWAI